MFDCAVVAISVAVVIFCLVDGFSIDGFGVFFYGACEWEVLVVFAD